MLETFRVRFKKITRTHTRDQPPVDDDAPARMHALAEEVPTCDSREHYKLYFVFCLVWAFGGCLFQDQLGDHWVEFTKWFINELKSVKFPSHGTVFDYYIDPATSKFEP